MGSLLAMMMMALPLDLALVIVSGPMMDLVTVDLWGPVMGIWKEVRTEIQ